MAINLTGGLPPEILGQQQQLNRQQQMAQMLMQQGMQQPQGQMVSGRFVQPSIFAQLAPLAQMFAGQTIAERGDKRALDLAKQLRQTYGDEVKEFRNLLQGREELAPQQAGPTQTGMPIPQEMVRGTPNPQGAYDFAAGAFNPALQAVGMKKMTEGPMKLGADETLIDPMTFKPIASGGQKVSPEIRQAMQQLGINKPLEQLNPQELNVINQKIDFNNRSKATNINMPSEGERKAGFMANILDNNILQMQNALGVDPTAVKPNVPASIVSAIAGENVLSRSITPAQRQIVEDSQLDVLDAALTLRTGAAYTREQLIGMRGTYFPRIGDSPETVKAKQGRLETLLSSAYIASGRASPNRVSAKPTDKPAGGAKNVPKGLDPAVFNAMTDAEKALFQ